MTGIQILRTNDKKAAKDLLHKLSTEKIPFSNPKLHAELLGYPYNKDDFEGDSDNGIKRLMTELKILSIFGKHNCPPILTTTKRTIYPHLD